MADPGVLRRRSPSIIEQRLGGSVGDAEVAERGGPPAEGASGEVLMSQSP
jgi:hypothetical protein